MGWNGSDDVVTIKHTPKGFRYRSWCGSNEFSYYDRYDYEEMNKKLIEVWKDISKMKQTDYVDNRCARNFLDKMLVDRGIVKKQMHGNEWQIHCDGHNCDHCVLGSLGVGGCLIMEWEEEVKRRGAGYPWKVAARIVEILESGKISIPESVVGLANKFARIQREINELEHEKEYLSEWCVEQNILRAIFEDNYNLQHDVYDVDMSLEEYHDWIESGFTKEERERMILKCPECGNVMCYDGRIYFYCGNHDRQYVPLRDMKILVENGILKFRDWEIPMYGLTGKEEWE